MSDRITLLAPGVFLGDEVTRSGDPPRHADGVVTTILREGLRWCALQISPGNEVAAPLLREACARRGAAFGTWAQGLRAADELAAIRAYGATFHIANVESGGEDAAWTDEALDELTGRRLEHGLGVIFTEGAWGRDRVRSQRWRDRGFVAIPEAIVSENPHATIGAMLDLARVLGWPAERTAPCLYLTRAFPAAGYAPEIAATAGRWSLFRYGDVDAGDWAAMRSWPHAEPPPAGPPPKPETPPKPEAPVRTPASAPRPAPALVMRSAIVAAVERWNPNPPPTSRGAIIRRIAQTPDAAWRALAPQLAAALDAAEAPGGGGGAAPATPPSDPSSRAPSR